MKWFDYTALTIVILGAVNWLLMGVFQLNFILYCLGNEIWMVRFIYTIIGLCGLYLISLYGRIMDMCH